MTIKLLRETKPDYIAYCFDRKDGSFRNELYTEYKANRSDAFGEFRIDKLKPSSGRITLEIKFTGYQEKSINVELGESQYLGCLELLPV